MNDEEGRAVAEELERFDLVNIWLHACIDAGYSPENDYSASHSRHLTFPDGHLSTAFSVSHSTLHCPAVLEGC